MLSTVGRTDQLTRSGRWDEMRGQPRSWAGVGQLLLYWNGREGQWAASQGLEGSWDSLADPRSVEDPGTSARTGRGSHDATAGCLPQVGGVPLNSMHTKAQLRRQRGTSAFIPSPGLPSHSERNQKLTGDASYKQTYFPWLGSRDTSEPASRLDSPRRWGTSRLVL